MNATTDILRGELERLFDLDELKKLSDELLDLDPEKVGGTDGKGAFARALVERCLDEDALLALADAVLASKQGVNEKIRNLFDGGPGEELKPGTELAQFRILKKMGEGGIGVVYLGEHQNKDEKVRAAIKVVRPLHIRNRSAARRWQTALRIQKGIDNRSFAQVLEVGTLEDGRPWVATQFVEGQSLATRVARTGAMHYNEARPAIRGVLDALETLHAKGLVHGDVKTENVFIVRPSSAEKMQNEPTGVLVDGGIDRLFERSPVVLGHSGLHPVYGTAKAIAPELARGGRANAATDLYAVGCLLYETLTGRPPFIGDTGLDIVAQHLVSEPAPPSEHAARGWVSKDLDAIVLRSIAKDPKARYKSAAAFREALESIGRASIPPAAREKKDLDEEKFEAARAEILESPGNEELAIALERLVEPADAWDKAVEVLQQAVEKVDDANTKTALYFRIARMQEADLKDTDSAETTYQKILEIDPDDVIAAAAIEELKRASGDAEGLVELLLEKVEGEESADERAAILREIGQTYEQQLTDPENAFVAYVQALAEEPRDLSTAGEVERLAGDSAERWNEAIEALNETLESLEDDSEKVPLYVLMGRWYADHLNRPDFAVPCFGQALALDPSHDGALAGTIALYRKAQSWQELVAMLLSRAEASANPAKARDWRAEAATVVYKKMGDADRAAEIYEEIIKDDAAHPEAAEALEGIYTNKKSWKPLVGLLENKTKTQRGEDRVATLASIAEIYEDRLDDLNQAAAHYEAALKHEEHHVVSLKGLERIYARGGQFNELLGNLGKQLEIAATPRQKIALLERMGAIQLEEFVDHEKAEQLYAQVTEIEPGHEVANTALTRIYRKLQRFDDLALTLQRHALGSEDEERKVSLLLQASKTLMVDVGAPDRAIKMLERVTSLRPEHPEALELISRLEAQTGDASKALEATERLAMNEKVPAKKAEHLFRAGRILEDNGDNDGAIERYRAALDAHPQNAQAATALRAIYASRGDAHGAAELLQREIEHTEGELAKAKLYAELGELRLDRLEDPKKARQAFKKALDHDPTCTPAARRLGDMAFEKGDWERAAIYFEPLLGRTDQMPADEARDLAMRCGDSFRNQQMYDKAQRAYLNAKAFASDDREVLERVAEVTFDAGSHDEAAVLYKELLIEFGGDLVGGEKGRILWRQGESLRLSGQGEEAITILEESATLMPDDPKPLASLREVYASQNNWEEVVRTLRRRMESSNDEERFLLLVEAGDVLMSKLGDKTKASKSYVQALELRGDDRGLLGKLMAVYSESKDWSRLVEVILRIAELVDDAMQLAKYYHTAAAISHFELNRLEEAADYYEQALEHDANSLKSFEGLVTALNTQKDWERLEEVYRGRLKRKGIEDDPKAAAHLWDQLAELLLHRLENQSDATEAFEEAQKLDPGNRRRAEQLAEVYGAEPKRYFQKAVTIHGDLLSLNPYRIESYQALRKLYTEAKKPDQSWCVCQALTVLKNAEPDEESFFKKHRTKGPAAATSSISNDQFARYVTHPSQDALLTDIFSTIVPAVIATSSQPLAKFSLDASNKIDPGKDEADVARTLHYAAGVSEIALPDVYYQIKEAGSLSFVFSDPPAIGLGQGALAGGPSKALAFVAGRHLSYFRGGHYLRMMVPTGSGLRTWLLAAIKTAVGQFPIPKNMAQAVEEQRGAFKQHLTGPDQERLRSFVQKLLADAPELDLKKWVAAVDLTADRLGFILANDLEIATAVVRASPEGSAGVPQKERLKELHHYSVSEEYLALRTKLGVAIGS